MTLEKEILNKQFGKKFDKVLKKEYLFTVKMPDGKIKKIRRPISLYYSHRSCIVDEDQVVEHLRNQLKNTQSKIISIIDKRIEELKHDVIIKPNCESDVMKYEILIKQLESLKKEVVK
jgi:hypothetical protein